MGIVLEQSLGQQGWLLRLDHDCQGLGDAEVCNVTKCAAIHRTDGIALGVM
jgi:hypothetical protein